MQSRCPHPQEIGDRCPTKCAFASCHEPQHETTSDPALVFDPDVDRDAAIKEGCIFCAFFLKRGPKRDGAKAG